MDGHSDVLWVQDKPDLIMALKLVAISVMTNLGVFGMVRDMTKLICLVLVE